MSQNVNPLNGGKKTVQVTPSSLPGIYISEPYQKSKGLEPKQTEWVPGGRPIYDRLPASSERYKVEFGLEDNKAYVYLPVGNSIFGPNSLGIEATNEGQFLTIKSGSAVWKYGEVKLDPVIINVKDVGFGNSKFTFAYQFFLDDSEFEAIYNVEGYSLRGYPMKVLSGTDSVKGWRYPAQYAFYGSDNVEWRNYDPIFSDYSSAAYLTWQFSAAAVLSKIEARCPKSSVVKGSAKLFLASSEDGEEPHFELVASSEVQTDSDGPFFVFSLDHQNPANTWKIEWSDNKISVNDILVTGSIPILETPGEAQTRVSLVAYPQGTLPKFTTDASGNKVPAVYCTLAQVEIDGNYTVTGIADLRESVNTTYQPIAEWLTRPWDETLIEMLEQMNNYAEYWMSPDTCMKQEYQTFTKLLSQ